MERLKTYIINLESQRARRERISAVVCRYPELGVEFVKGVVGRDLSEDEKRRWVHPRYSKIARTMRMTDPELGCALSHMVCYARLLADGAPAAMILEDDVLVGERFSQASLTSLHFLTQTKRPAVVLLSARTFCRRRPSYRSPDGICIHKAFYGVGAYGYAVNRRGAEVLTRKMAPFKHPCDHWYLIRRLGVDVYAVVPHAVSFAADLSDSSLHSERHRGWLEYCRHVQDKGNWFQRHYPHVTWLRCELKIRKLVFGAIDCPKIWPQSG